MIESYSRFHVLNCFFFVSFHKKSMPLDPPVYQGRRFNENARQPVLVQHKKPTWFNHTGRDVAQLLDETRKYNEMKAEDELRTGKPLQHALCVISESCVIGVSGRSTQRGTREFWLRKLPRAQAGAWRRGCLSVSEVVRRLEQQRIDRNTLITQFWNPAQGPSPVVDRVSFQLTVPASREVEMTATRVDPPQILDWHQVGVSLETRPAASNSTRVTMRLYEPESTTPLRQLTPLVLEVAKAARADTIIEHRGKQGRGVQSANDQNCALWASQFQARVSQGTGAFKREETVFSEHRLQRGTGYNGVAGAGNFFA